MTTPGESRVASPGEHWPVASSGEPLLAAPPRPNSSAGPRLTADDRAARGRQIADDDDIADWLRPLVHRIDSAVLPARLLRIVGTAPPTARHSAVLMLLGNGSQGPDLLLTARAVTLRAHPGQPAFPGGASEPGEDAVTTALREGREETGLDPGSVTPAALLPELYLGPSGFLVRPVLAQWDRPGPVQAVDPAETAAVARVPLAELSDPANRGQARHPSGYVGPAFTVAGMVVWGFTAALVDVLLDLGGWARPWDTARMIALGSRD